ncbi:MAG: hypothetical protein M1831_000544 [Alyxoria varia]|nr:MAG: hypothetical protein M1831_000544 [Alyxoria varia]
MDPKHLDHGMEKRVIALFEYVVKLSADEKKTFMQLLDSKMKEQELVLHQNILDKLETHVQILQDIAKLSISDKKLASQIWHVPRLEDAFKADSPSSGGVHSHHPIAKPDINLGEAAHPLLRREVVSGGSLKPEDAPIQANQQSNDGKSPSHANHHDPSKDKDALGGELAPPTTTQADPKPRGDAVTIFRDEAISTKASNQSKATTSGSNTLPAASHISEPSATNETLEEYSSVVASIEGEPSDVKASEGSKGLARGEGESRGSKEDEGKQGATSASKPTSFRIPRSVRKMRPASEDGSQKAQTASPDGHLNSRDENDTVKGPISTPAWGFNFRDADELLSHLKGMAKLAMQQHAFEPCPPSISPEPVNERLSKKFDIFLDMNKLTWAPVKVATSFMYSFAKADQSDWVLPFGFFEALNDAPNDYGVVNAAFKTLRSLNEQDASLPRISYAPLVAHTQAFALYDDDPERPKIHAKDWSLDVLAVARALRHYEVNLALVTGNTQQYGVTQPIRFAYEEYDWPFLPIHVEKASANHQESPPRFSSIDFVKKKVAPDPVSNPHLIAFDLRHEHVSISYDDGDSPRTPSPYGCGTYETWLLVVENLTHQDYNARKALSITSSSLYNVAHFYTGVFLVPTGRRAKTWELEFRRPRCRSVTLEDGPTNAVFELKNLKDDRVTKKVTRLGWLMDGDKYVDSRVDVKFIRTPPTARFDTIRITREPGSDSPEARQGLLKALSDASHANSQVLVIDHFEELTADLLLESRHLQNAMPHIRYLRIAGCGLLFSSEDLFESSTNRKLDYDFKIITYHQAPGVKDWRRDGAAFAFVCKSLHHLVSKHIHLFDQNSPFVDNVVQELASSAWPARRDELRHWVKDRLLDLVREAANRIHTSGSSLVLNRATCSPFSPERRSSGTNKWPISVRKHLDALLEAIVTYSHHENTSLVRIPGSGRVNRAADLRFDSVVCESCDLSMPGFVFPKALRAERSKNVGKQIKCELCRFIEVSEDHAKRNAAAANFLESCRKTNFDFPKLLYSFTTTHAGPPRANYNGTGTDGSTTRPFASNANITQMSELLRQMAVNSETTVQDPTTKISGSFLAPPSAEARRDYKQGVLTRRLPDPASAKIARNSDVFWNFFDDICPMGLTGKSCGDGLRACPLVQLCRVSAPFVAFADS